MTGGGAVGVSWTRSDAAEKVTGRAVYSADISLPGMLHARILRSPVPHARVVHVDADRARRLSGVGAVLTRGELVPYGGRARYGPILCDQGVVALERVRFVGDPVAAVAAADVDIAAEALALIDVDYEELPAVFSAEAALKPDAVILHGDVYEEEMPGTRPVPGTNVCGATELVAGDPDRAFADADDIVEETYTTPPVQHCHLEPHATLAAWDGGRLTVWTCSQTPFLTRRQLARLHGVSAAEVRVVVPYIGGGYGAKTNLRLEPIVSHLARLAGRPVRLVLEHQEVFLVVTKHAARVRIRSALRGGRLVARETDVVLDTGAYADTGPQVARKCTLTAGPYHIPHVRMKSLCVYTNNPPAGSFRGFGLQQMAWAHEGHTDTLARRLAIDPVEFRLRHLYAEGDRYVTGEPLHAIGLRQCLQAVAGAIHDRPLASRPGTRRGRGVAIAMKAAFAPTTAGAWLRLNEDGSALIMAPTPEMGQGARTALRQIAADVLTLPPARVQMAPVDTDVLPFDDGAISSRSTFAVGRAVRDAAHDVRGQLLALASRHLEAAVSDLVLTAGRIAVAGTGVEIEIPELLRARLGRSGVLTAQAIVRVPGGRHEAGTEAYDVTASFWFLAAGAAEVEVDEETGRVRVDRYVTAADVGRAINPHACATQIRGAATIGLGQALSEQLRAESGQLVNGSFSDYRIPAFRDMPGALQVILVEVPHAEGPFGAKGVGEVGVAPVAAAVAGGLRAAGVHLRDLPLTPEAVLRALRERPA